MHDPVSVYSIFHEGRIKPLYFLWKRSRIKVETITYTWNTMDENGVNMHFSVLSGEFYYELVYQVSQSRWYVEQVELATA